MQDVSTCSMASIFFQRSKFDEPGIDCMELFGGAGTTAFMLAKYHGLRTGVNFELRCGIDLHKVEDIQYLFAYVRRNKPKVILLAPPCKGYSRWGHLNKMINYDAWLESRKLSVPLARLSGNVAAEQVSAGRHAFVEQPYGSGLYDEPEWVRLKPLLFTAVFDQCMTGLRMNKPPWWPVRKTTECKASHPSLLVNLQNLRCNGKHPHAHIGSWSETGRPTVRSSDMQIWPQELCERIAAGVVECIHDMESSNATFFPAISAAAGDAPKAPAYTCPACLSHLRKTDPKHVRDDTCKFKDVESISWSCPGCLARRNRTHDSHTNDENCQWAIARLMPEGVSRERTATHPRDGRVPASSDPSSRMRQEGRGDGIPGDLPPALPEAADSAEAPEILSPEEADERRRQKAQPVRRRADAEVQVEQPRPLAARANAEAENAIALPGEQAIVQAAQPPGDGIPAWSKHDLRFALQQLRSIREGVVRRTWRKLHLRWYHAGSRKMQVLLEAAGVSPHILAMIPSIIDTCDKCAHWQRPGPRSVASTRLPETFNKEVQIDLLFYKTHVILHCIDACTRWTAVSLLANREPSSIIDGFAACWVRLFGPPTTVLSDQEGGLITDTFGDWLDRRGIQVEFRARGQHCGMVERHNEILRRQLHVLEDQSNAEGLAVPFTTVVSEAVFAIPAGQCHAL